MSTEGHLPDGTYDVFVLVADESGDDTLRLSVTIVSGDHKGDVVDLTATGLGIDEIEAMGMPGTLTVSAGEPSFRVDTL